MPSREQQGDPDAYLIETDELYRKIEETIALGGNQILLQGGMHHDLKIDWYESLLRDIKQHFPTLNVHGFSPPEIDYIATVSGLSIREVLERLKLAGLGSLPGGGAEILVDRVRQQVSPCKSLRRPLAGNLPHVAQPRRARLGHDDVRPPRIAGRSDRTSGSAAHSAR